MHLRIISALLFICVLAACKDRGSSKSHGPIVLGDSNTIVTENDPNALHDQVTDLQPLLPTDQEQPAAEEKPVAVVANVPPPQTPNTAVPTGSGLQVPFKELSIFIPGIKTRTYGKPDFQTARGASYELIEGTLAGSKLVMTGGTINKVSQRYSTMVQLDDGTEKLNLESLGRYMSDWQPLPGANGNYLISGLDPSKLSFKETTPASIRNAVQQAARKKRLDRNDTQEWLDAVRKVRSVNQAPSRVTLRSVMWRIEGKDAKGKSFNKELRIDFPL